MRKIFLFLLIVFFLHFFIFPVQAEEREKYVTVVTPIRSRDKWLNFTLVKKQILFLVQHEIPSTILLQYSLFDDNEVISFFQNLPKTQELGLFLEIDENLSKTAFVPYRLGDGDWARADKVLLSGYTPSERLRLIDKAMEKFRKIFGKYPACAGAWYIDTISLNYLKRKYNLEAFLEVSDQYETDTYGVWGKPWGTPYYPSKINSLFPAQDEFDKLDLVKIQWAPRDPVRGYGLTVFDSTYSLQVNDYFRHGFNLSYFAHLAENYLNSPNLLNQITFRLEAGQEGAKFFEEYKNELILLKKWEKENKLKFVTMEEFAKFFKAKNPIFNPPFLITGEDIKQSDIQAFWYNTSFYRVGLLKEGEKLILRDFRFYQPLFLFEEIIAKDENKVLKRVIPALIGKEKEGQEKILFFSVVNLVVNHQDNKLTMIISLKNGEKHSLVFDSYGIILDNLKLFDRGQFVSKFDFLKRRLTWKLIDYQMKKNHQWKRSFRFSKIFGVYYFGIDISPTQFLGFVTKSPYFVLEDLPFSVLSHFQSLPEFSPFPLLARYFINYVNHSTISLISSKKL